MAIETEIQPYELLVRWKNGQVVGCHKRQLVITRDGGEIISEAETKATPLEQADVPAFFGETDVVAQISGVLALNDQLTAQALEADQARNAAVGAARALEARLADAMAENARLKSENARLKAEAEPVQ